MKMFEFGNERPRLIASGTFEKWFVKIDMKNSAEILVLSS